MNPKKPMNPIRIRGRVQRYGARDWPSEIPSMKAGESSKEYIKRAAGYRGAIIGGIESVLKKYLIDEPPAVIEYERKLVFAYLTLPDTAKFWPVDCRGITPQFWNGLSRWQSLYNKDKWEYITRETFPAEVMLVNRFANWSINQQLRNGGLYFGDLLKIQVEAMKLKDGVRV